MRYHVCQFSEKMDNLEFLGPNLSKNGNFKNLSLDLEAASLKHYVHQFSANNFEFLGPNLYKNWPLGSKFQKSKSGFGISILKILCAPIFRQNEQLWIFGPKFGQKWILGSEFQKSKSGFRINTSNIPCVPIFSQNGQLLIFRSKFGEIA